MDIEHLFSVLGITNSRVKSKAKEYLRVTGLKAPAGIGKGNVCKAAVCICFACKKYNVAFDKEKAVRACATTNTIYNFAFTAMQGIHNVKFLVTFRELAIRFNSLSCIEAAKTILERYKKLFISGLPEIQKKNVDFSLSVFTVVSFYIAMVRNNKKKKVDKQKLCDSTNISITEFNKVLRSMYELCYPGEKSGAKTVPGRRLNDNLLPSNSNSNSDDEKSKKRIREEDYNTWRNNILNEASKLRQKKKQKS